MTFRQQQLPLFQEQRTPEEGRREQGPRLTADSRLSATIDAFQDHMIEKEFTENTINSFLGDLSLFRRYLQDDLPIGQISTRKLNDFLTYLVHGRQASCTPKSYARRVTTLKVFFGWLAETNVIVRDIAAPVVHRPASSPLPMILDPQQISSMLDLTRSLLRHAENPDPRPHLLVSLILTTGIKKGECMRIALGDMDLSNPAAPALHVRYDNPRRRYKERKLRLPADFASTFSLYRRKYKPQARLFECTPRNLEYVLADVAKQAGLSTALSFETLRMTCAVRDHTAGMDEDTLRRKLGLSKIAWRETLEKINKLTAHPL
jgi:site-specific recombinase XerD